MIVPSAGISLFAYWALQTGITLVPAGDLGWVALIPHSLTLVIELQAYVLFLLGTYVLGRSWAWPASVGAESRRGLHPRFTATRLAVSACDCPARDRRGVRGVLVEILRRVGRRRADGAWSPSAMSEEETQALIAAYADSGPPVDSVTETRGNQRRVLRYQADRLVEIMPAMKQRPLFLDGRDVFSLRQLEPLALLERLNESPGRYADTGAAFDNLAISVEGFCVTDPAAGVRTLDEADERFQGRATAASMLSVAASRITAPLEGHQR